MTQTKYSIEKTTIQSRSLLVLSIADQLIKETTKMPKITRNECTEMKDATSFELRNGMQENMPIHKTVMGNVDTLAKALDGNSSKYDLDTGL